MIVCSKHNVYVYIYVLASRKYVMYSAWNKYNTSKLNVLIYNHFILVDNFIGSYNTLHTK